MANEKEKKAAHELDVVDPQGSLVPKNVVLGVPVRRCHPVPALLNRLATGERILYPHEIDRREISQLGSRLQFARETTKGQIANLERLDQMCQETHSTNCHRSNAYVELAIPVIAE
jgi:hypothetical protein